MDLNPVFLYENELKIIDARIILKKELSGEMKLRIDI